MHPYLRRTDTSNGFEMAWALCASLIFHVLLVLTLTSSSIYYPVTGPETRFDVIWATPSALPREPTATAEVKPLRNPPGLQQETATLEPQLPQNGPPPASPPPASGDEVQNERAAGELSQDLEVFTVLAKAPTLSEAAPAAVKTVALSRRDLTQKREPVSVRHRQQTPQTAEMALEEQPPPAPIPASPAKTDPRPLAQLQDGPELTPQRNPARLNLPRTKKELDLQVAQVQITRDGDDESQQSARGTDITVMPPEAKRGKSSPEQDVPLPDAEIPAPLTAQKERIRAAERENADGQHAERERRSRQARLVQEHEKQKRQAARLKAEQEQHAARLKAEGEKRVSVEAASKPLPLGRQEYAAAKSPGDQNLPAPEGVRAGKTAVAIGKVTEPAPPGTLSQSASKPAEKPARGLVIAVLHGDLKLVMTGDTGIKVTVKFRDYPKSRRNRVLTRSEVRKEQTVTPLLAAPREDTREAVVQTAREGIYLFSAEPAGGRAVRATFVLKVFESGARERTAALGNRSLSGPTVLVKILMPEAILWDDESAFTGSMEDSESETRFNATTGLYWKEFRD